MRRLNSHTQEAVHGRIARSLARGVIGIAVLMGVVFGGHSTAAVWTHTQGHPAIYAQIDSPSTDGPWDNTTFSG
jgi:hypothetical protein